MRSLALKSNEGEQCAEDAVMSLQEMFGMVEKLENLERACRFGCLAKCSSNSSDGMGNSKSFPDSKLPRDESLADTLLLDGLRSTMQELLRVAKALSESL